MRNPGEVCDSRRRSLGRDRRGPLRKGRSCPGVCLARCPSVTGIPDVWGSPTRVRRLWEGEATRVHRCQGLSATRTPAGTSFSVSQLLSGNGGHFPRKAPSERTPATDSREHQARGTLPPPARPPSARGGALPDNRVIMRRGSEKQRALHDPRHQTAHRSGEPRPNRAFRGRR